MSQVKADQGRIHRAVATYIAQSAPPKGFVQRTQSDLHNQETAAEQQRFRQEAQIDVPGNSGDLMGFFIDL